MFIILYIVYRVLSLSVNPMLRTYINLSKQHRLCLRKKLPRHVGLTSTICRNFEFYQNDTKIWRKLAYEMYSFVQLLGGAKPPDHLTRGSAPGPRWGHSQPPDPHYRLALPRSPQMLKPNSAYDYIYRWPIGRPIELYADT